MRDIFERYSVVEFEAFAAYLLGIMAKVLPVERNRETHNYLNVAEKIDVLCNALADSDDPNIDNIEYHKLQFQASLIGSVLPTNKLLDYYDTKALYIKNREEMRQSLHEATNDDFLGAATARRILWAHYQSKDCKQGYYTDDRCYHQLHIRLLKELADRSHVEVKSMVLLAAGTRLPVELTDLLTQYVLAAEEVPLNTAITMESEAEKPRRKMKVLPQYDCGRIKKIRPKQYRYKRPWNKDSSNPEYSDSDHEDYD